MRAHVVSASVRHVRTAHGRMYGPTPRPRHSSGTTEVLARVLCGQPCMHACTRALWTGAVSTLHVCLPACTCIRVRLPAPCIMYNFRAYWSPWPPPVGARVVFCPRRRHACVHAPCSGTVRAACLRHGPRHVGVQHCRPPPRLAPCAGATVTAPHGSHAHCDARAPCPAGRGRAPSPAGVIHRAAAAPAARGRPAPRARCPPPSPRPGRPPAPPPWRPPWTRPHPPSGRASAGPAGPASPRRCA